MNTKQTKQDLLREVQALTVRLQEAEEIIQAIRTGEVDGLLVTTPEGERVFTLEGAELPYRIFVESMNEGAATITHDGVILYSNPSFARMLRLPQEKVIHRFMHRFIHPADRETFAAIFKKGAQGRSEGEVLLRNNTPVQISLQPLPLYGPSPVVCAVITDRTRQKKLKTTIASLNRSRAVFNQAADVIIVCDEQGIITQASRETQRYGGTILLGLYLDDAFNITFPSGLPLHKKVFTVADVLKGRIFRKQEAMLVAGEKTFHLLLSAQPLRGKNREVLGCVVTLTDMTARKQAEEKTKKQAMEIEQLYHNAPVGLCMLDKDLRFLRINERMAEMNGIPAAEHVGKSIRELMPQLADEVEPQMHRTLKTGEPQLNSEVISETPAQPGVKRRWQEQWLPIKDESGRVTGLNIVIEETTERMRIVQMLRESEEKFRSAFANAAIGFAMANPEGGFVDANSAYCRITGYSIEELRGMGWPQMIHPDDYAENMRVTDRILSGQINSAVLENRYVSKDGAVVWVRKSISLVRNAEGEPQLVLALIEDITTRKQAEEALRQRTLELEMLSAKLEQRVLERTEELRILNQELQKSQSRLKHLSQDLLDAQEKERKKVAWELHDSIGSSLMAIKFRIENALREGGSHAMANLEKVVPVVQTAVMEAKRIQMNLRPSMLDDLGIVATARWFFSQFRETYPEIQLEQHIKIEEDDVPDSLKTVIFRIFQEGLNNAARHSKSPVVSLYLWKSNRTLKLIIRDRGQGFDLSEVQSRTVHSRGLGLESMRERAELSGGCFSVATRQGKGTVVRVSWPISSNS